MKLYVVSSLLIVSVLLTTLLSLANSSLKIDLNSATHLQLEKIPGIGPALAKKIITERDKRGGFRSVEDLLKVQGIGRKLLLKIKRFLRVNPISIHE